MGGYRAGSHQDGEQDREENLPMGTLSAAQMHIALKNETHKIPHSKLAFEDELGVVVSIGRRFLSKNLRKVADLKTDIKCAW